MPCLKKKALFISIFFGFQYRKLCLVDDTGNLRGICSKRNEDIIKVYMPSDGAVLR